MKHSIMVALFLTLIFIGLAQAKRVGPKDVAPIIHNGVKYTAPHGKMGYVEAWDVSSGKKLWETKVYDVEMKPMLEKDVQMVYITSLSIEDGRLVVINENNAKYYLNPANGQKIQGLAPAIAKPDKTSEEVHLFPVPQNGKYGYMDKTGKIVIEPMFDYAAGFSDGMAAVMMTKDGAQKIGYIDSTGKVVIEPRFEAGYDFKEGLAPVQINGLVGYIDKTGKVVIEPQFRGAMSFSEGLAPIMMTEDWGFIDRTGKIVIKEQFDGVDRFFEGLAPARVCGQTQFGYIDKAGQFVIKPAFASAGVFNSGLAPVRLNNDPDTKEGYIDKTGQLVIKPQFDLAGEFSEGLAAVIPDGGAEHGKYGYIDKTGKVVIEPIFDGAEAFSGGLAKVFIGNNCGYIDKVGKFIWEPAK
ncbi:MAG: WG repeat-containing protein [Candidatus Brocadiia bacterium]